MGELANTQPTREQHFDDGAIALSLRLREVDAAFQLVDLGGGEHLGQMLAQAWRLKQLGGVGIDAAVEQQPTVERSNAAEDACLRRWADAEFVNAGSKVLQVFEFHLQHVLLLAVAIGEQMAQVVPIGLEGVGRVVALQFQIAHIGSDDIFLRFLVCLHEKS